MLLNLFCDFFFLLGTGLLGESCIWQGLAGGNVEVSKDFYIEGFLKKTETGSEERDKSEN